MTVIRGATPAWVSVLTDAWLELLHGPATVARAAGYVEQGMVRSVSAVEEGTVVMAEVEGSGRWPYTTLITALVDVPEGLPIRAADVDWVAKCSCPVGVGCKHALAALMVLRDQGGGGAAHVASWRERLAAYAVEPVAPLHETPLGVQFVLVSGPPGSWGQGSRRVEIRPLRRSRVGRWVSVSSWSQAVSGQGHEFVPPDHLAAASDLARVIGQSRFGWGSTAPALLDDLGSEAWRWLHQAMAAGIEVRVGGVVGRAGLDSMAIEPDAVELVPAATITRGEGGGLLASVAWHDVRPDQKVTLIGGNRQGTTPPHSVLIEPRSGHGTRVVRPLGPLTPEVLELVGSGELSVPAEDVGEFLSDYLPGLRRRLTVQSPDAAVDATATSRPVLCVHLSGDSEVAALLLSFGIRYLVGDHRGPLLPVDIPPVMTTRRDRSLEADLLHGIPELEEVPGCRLGVHNGRIHRVPPATATLTGRDAVRFMGETLDALRAREDVEVEIAESTPTFEEASEPAALTLDVDEALDGSTDWFDLSMSVLVEGEPVPLADLLVALRRGDEILVLPSGVWFRLDQPAFAALRALVLESQLLVDGESGTVRIGRYDLGWWEELVGSGLVGRQCEAWRRHAAVLGALDLAEAVPLPDGLQATLRAYQGEGYQWLRALWDAGLGGILADDMGLGKTLQTLALLQRAKERGELGGGAAEGAGPVLVVAPTSVVGTWVSEAEKFAPSLRVLPIRATGRKRGRSLLEELSGDDGDGQGGEAGGHGPVDVVVSSYAVARIDAAEFASVSWRGLILDEAQQVKNHRSKTYQAVRRLDRTFTLAITGTPIENDLMDLWSQLSLATPGLFPSPDVFHREWSRPIAGGNAEVASRLRSRIRPLLLRRTKEEVAPDLPPKTESVVRLDMTPGHRRIYDRALLRERQCMLGLLEDPEANRVEILAALTRMRQLALDPALVPELSAPGGAAGGPVDLSTLPSSAKVDHLIDQLIELSAEGHRALVFSQFTSFLARVRARLDSAGIASAYLDGGTRDRQRVIKDFKEGDSPVFLISLKAGGVGLTLTEADYVFVLDPWWNPAAEAQAIDRAHRIGQDKPVLVYRLVSADSIEDKVLALQDRKRALADRLVGGGSFTGALERDEILALFEPTRGLGS